MRLVRLLVAAMSSFATPQAAAPTPEPPAAIVAPAPAVPDKPFHSFMTPWGTIKVDDDVCDTVITPDGPPLFFFLAPDGGAFSVSNQNCADAVRKWMFSRTVRLPRA